MSVINILVHSSIKRSFREKVFNFTSVSNKRTGKIATLKLPKSQKIPRDLEKSGSLAMVILLVGWTHLDQWAVILFSSSISSF